MKQWHAVRMDELSSVEPARLNTGHSFTVISKHVAWPRYCRYCGLIPLKNEFSQLCVRLGCYYETDKRYKQYRDMQKTRGVNGFGSTGK